MKRNQHQGLAAAAPAVREVTRAMNQAGVAIFKLYMHTTRKVNAIAKGQKP